MYTALQNKKIVITGITGGIAHAAAELLISLGAEVIVTARDKTKLQTSLSALSGKVHG